ncbi:MAG: Ig-like domain-containing protein [Treponema sp.]|nr:Ig-like domain-containing protein [Treponema sp.]
MFKKNQKLLLLSSIIISAFLLLFSCSVGLGESVDTEVPKVEITYPPASSAVRDWFYLAGNCSDDKGVDSITVSAKNISTNENVTLGTATPAKDGTWQIKINEKDGDGNYKLKDGTYTFSVIATDSSKQQSAPNIRTLEIDNTAPVFVIKNPGTTKVDSPAPFGSILKIVGAAADEHDIYELELKVYTSADMSGEPKAVLTENNVDKTDGINVTLARYNPDVENGAAADELHNNYLKVYDVEGGGDQQLYASVTLKDSAGVWQNPLHTTADSIGNSTSGGLYLNDDIYDELMGKNSKYGLSATDFMKIINGTYKTTASTNSETENSENNRSADVDALTVTDENIQTILEILSKNKTETSATPLSFKLNKNANPTYEVMGFAFKIDEADSFGSHKAAKKSSLTFKAQAGLDGTYIQPSSLKVYLFGPYDSCSAEQLEEIRTEPESYYNSAVSKAKEDIKKSTGNENPSEELIEATANARILKDYSASSASSTESFSEAVELPSAITKGRYYLLAASGKDIDGLSLLTQNYYGFLGESAGTPPAIVINGFTDGLMTNVLGNVKLSGTLESEETELAGVTYSIAVFDEIKAKNVATITGEATLDFKDSKKLSADWTIKDFSKGNKTYANDYSSFEPKDSERFKYSVTVSGKDRTGLESKDTKSFTVDMKKPEIKINDVTPVAKKETTESGGTKYTKYTVNGTINFSAVVTDTNLENVKATVSDGTKTETLFDGNNSTIEKSIDTTEYSDNSTLTFTVVATDNAGNTTEVSKSDVFVSQETDKPVISFTNGKTSAELGDGWTNVTNGQNVFGIDNNNSANFTITDDDGIASVEVTVFDESGNKIDCSGSNDYQLQPQSDSSNAKETAANPVKYEVTGGATSHAISYKLPKKAGKYKIQLDVLDTGYANAVETNKKWHTTTVESYILVSEGNISISFVDILNNTCQVNANNDAAIGGTISVSSLEKLASIERFVSTKETSKDADGKDVVTWKKATMASAKYPYVADEQDVTEIKATESNGKISWTDTIPSGKIEDGEQHFFYQATDIAGNSAEIELVCNGDGYAPEIKNDSEVYKKYENWVNSSSVTLSVIAADVKGYSPSGIKKVSYLYNEGTTGELSRGNEKCDETGKTDKEGKYYKYSTIIDLGESADGTMITFTAEDNVGNKMPLGPLYYKVDTTAPEVESISVAESQVLNNSGSIKVSYSVSDKLSGIKAVEFSTNSNMSGAKTDPNVNENGTYDYSLTGLADGEYNIYVRVTDNAGNKLENINAGSFIVDSTAPKVTITSPSSGNIVNKTISLSGTVVDNNLSKNKTPVLQYFNGTSWSDFEFASSNLDGQNWTISGIDTTKLNNSTDSKEVEFRVLFTDDAGNANESVNAAKSYKLNIDQNTDRPEIKLTNIKIANSITSSTEIMGVITDDDGNYDKLKLYRINKADYESNKSANETPSKSGNSWEEISVENGTGIWKTKLDADESQGLKSWYFYVVDSDGGTFCTAESSQLNRPYLSDSEFSKIDNTTGISFTFDNKAPDVSLKISHDGTNWEDTNSIFGVNNSVWIKAIVKEEVGMKSATLSIGGTEVQKITENPTPIEGVYEYLFSEVKLATYKDISSLAISVTAEDSAGQTNKDMRNITVDSKAPSVKIVSPTTSSSDIVSSAVSIKGTVLDDYSSIEFLKYAIPFKDSSKEPDWKNVGTSAAWEIRFASGAQESSESLIYYAVAKDTNGYLYDIKQTGTEDVYEVPIWFYVKDSAGNEAYIKDQYVLVDSESGKPKAWINSPADGTTTSGVVTIYGGAIDNVTVDKVCVQIDANNDGKFDLEDKKYISDFWNDEKDGLRAKLSSSASDTDESWYILANGTNSWKLDIDSSCIKEVVKTGETSKSQTLRIRVKAIDDDGLSRAWTEPIEIIIDGEKPVIKNIKLVQYGKDIVPTDSSDLVTEREYISGMYISNVSVAQSGKWYLTADVLDNEKVASIEFTRNDSLSENNIYFEDEDEKQPDVKEYKLRIPLKTDETGVISYRITATDNGGASFESSVTINIDNTPPSLYDINNRETVSPGENLRLKSMLKVLGTGSENSTVVNNNKYFNFGDYVQEGGSGLAYIAFYFERQGKNGENRVYNPMFGGSNKTVLYSKPANPADGNVYVNSDGLAAMYVTDSSRGSVDSISLSAVNPNVRKGGLIKIAGSYSLITDVSGTTVKFSPSAATSFTEAEIIFAQIVDHKITESVDDSGNPLNDDGDKMIESIEQLGSSYTWSANIDSTNIPDGPIIIHVVAIDNAGNISSGSIVTKVENNRPRIAKVLLGADLNENDRYDWDASEAPVTTGDSEKDTKNGKAFGEFSYFSALNSVSGKAQSIVTLDSSKFKVIKGLCIIPEFVGGNNELGYILETPSDLDNATYNSGTVSAMTSKVSIISKVNNKGSYAIDGQISDFGGVEIPNVTSGNISITFWDKTEETEQGKDSQWALLKIPVELMSGEQEVPVPTITPFYWKNKNDNSVYFEDGIAKGHIELEADLPDEPFDEISGIYDRDPKVSGHIKIEGSVTDNVRIASIDMGFGKISSQTLAVYEKGEWKYENLPDGVESVTVNDEYISQDGHKVNYVIVINSEKIADVADTDKEISISAKDWKNNEGAGDVYRIDVVPYITQVWTDLSEYERTYASMNNRASTGEYPVRVGENITLYGWNLSSSTRSVTVGSNEISTTIVHNDNYSDVIRNTDFGLQFELPSIASGEVNVVINNVPALNNINNDNSHGTAKEISVTTDTQKAIADYSNYYNRLPNNQNNNLLNDNLKFDVWDFKTAVTPEGDSAEFVHMKVGPYMANNAEKSGRIGFSFKNGVGYFNMPGYAYGTSGTVTGKVDLYVSTKLTQYGAIRIWDEGGSSYYYAVSGNPKAQSGSNGDYYVYSYNVNFGTHKMGIILTSSEGSWNGQTGDIWVTEPGKYYITTETSLPSKGNNSVLSCTESYGYNDSSEHILYSHTKLGSAYQGFTYNTFAFDKNGETYGTALNSDTSGKDGMGGNLQFFSRAEAYSYGDYHDLNFNYYNNTNARRIENIFAYKDSKLKSDQKRTQSLSMATYTDSAEKTYVYNAYYDHLLGQITFRVGSVNGKGYGKANDIGLGLQDLIGFISFNQPGGKDSDEGKIGYDNSTYKVRTSTDSSYVGNVSGESAYKYVSKISGITGTAGYVAIGALQSSDAGRAVIVWYDEGNRALKMTSVSLSEILSGINGKSWSATTISTKGGQYVQMSIDAEDGIHLAYMSNSGADLYYAYMPSYDSSNITEILVDSKNDVGDNCSIDVGRDDESSPWIPVITYKSNEGTKTKIAYPVVFENGKPKDGATPGGFFTGNWSVSMLPTENKSTNDQINVGLNKDWNNGVIHEFVSGTDDTNSYTPKGPYSICSSGILYGNGTKNPVVGYAVSSGSIEMAQKK